MSADEFDNMPDDFADISGVDWDQILAGPSTPSSSANPASVEDQSSDLPGTGADIPIPSITTLASTSSSSSTYDFEDDYDGFDPSLLAELDRIEEEITRVAPQPPPESHSDLLPSHYFSSPKKRKDTTDCKPSEETPSVVLKKKRLDDTSCHSSPQGKGKMKANDDILPRILSGYEDEITCPICCDFYAFAHISNPCGHSFCGSCGREWHRKNKSCPVCRTRLENASPMIPNIAVDNIVEKHIQALILSGDQDWLSGGLKAEEWHKRKQAWRDGARGREKSSAGRRIRTFIPSVIDLTAIHAFNLEPNRFIEDNLEADPTYELEDAELIPQPIRRRRQRRRGRGGEPHQPS